MGILGQIASTSQNIRGFQEAYQKFRDWKPPKPPETKEPTPPPLPHPGTTSAQATYGQAGAAWNQASNALSTNAPAAPASSNTFYSQSYAVNSWPVNAAQTAPMPKQTLIYPRSQTMVMPGASPEAGGGGMAAMQPASMSGAGSSATRWMISSTR